MHSIPSSSRRKATPRRASSRNQPANRRRRGWRSKVALLSLGFLVLWFSWAALARVFAPTGNTDRNRFDALVVLGTHADSDGNPTPAMLSRVNEGVREYERGVAPRMILTGGFDGDLFREADVMARAAQARGVPASAIFIEHEANDTIQNACYSARIMKAHGWRSAEVIASSGQLPRAGLIFSRLPIDWRAHAAPQMEPPSAFGMVYGNAREILKTARYVLYASRTESCSP